MLPQKSMSDVVELLGKAELYNNAEAHYLGKAILGCCHLLAEESAQPEAYRILGYIHLKQGRHLAAIKSFRLAVAVDNSQSERHLELIRVVQMLGLRDDAILAARNMVACLPNSAKAYSVLSDVCLTANRMAEASAAFGMALELDPSLRSERRLETFKARARRQRQGFFQMFCQGRGLDIGWGGDLLASNCIGWDLEDGDSEKLKGVEDASFDFVYSSHNLEHMVNVDNALTNWWRVVKPGGHLILYVPHRDLYEKRTRLPSRFSSYHRCFFLPETDDAPDTIGLRPLLRRVLPAAEILSLTVCDEGHTVTDPDLHSDGEYSIEAICRKPLDSVPLTAILH
jgi:SAM-dependent methyltransferase